MNGQRRQRLNNVEQAANAEGTQDYETVAAAAAAAALFAIDHDRDSVDSIDLFNFLEEDTGAAKNYVKPVKELS